MTEYAEVQAFITGILRETIQAVLNEELRKVFPESQPWVDPPMLFVKKSNSNHCSIIRKL